MKMKPLKTPTQAVYVTLEEIAQHQAAVHMLSRNAGTPEQRRQAQEVYQRTWERAMDSKLAFTSGQPVVVQNNRQQITFTLAAITEQQHALRTMQARSATAEQKQKAQKTLSYYIQKIKDAFYSGQLNLSAKVIEQQISVRLPTFHVQARDERTLSGPRRGPAGGG